MAHMLSSMAVLSSGAGPCMLSALALFGQANRAVSAHVNQMSSGSSSSSSSCL